jgi:uncharacterized protein (DUF302 family)
MTSGPSTKLHISFGDTVQPTTRALADRGFGVLTKIDVKTTHGGPSDPDFSAWCG